MLVWEKKGKIFDPKEYSSGNWMNEFAQAPATLVLEDRVRVFFNTRPVPDSNGQFVSYSAYVDYEKNDFTKIFAISEKPLMELGNKGEFDEFGTYPVSIVKEGDVLHAYYGGWTRCESVPFDVSIGHAISYDNGSNFVKEHLGPVVSKSAFEPFVISGPKIRKFNDKYYLFYIAGTKWKVYDGRPEPIYKIRLAVSDDGVNWVKMNRSIIEDKLGDDEAQASPDVIFSNGRYHMFFCYREASDYRFNKDRSYRIGYAYSDDLINWTRDDDHAGIDVSPDGWDSDMVAYPHVFELYGKIHMMYLGNQVGRSGFGLAVLKGEL